jgi:L-arabinose isomerase
MSSLKEKKLIFLCGSQHLYGAKALEQVKKNANEIVGHLNRSPHIPVSIVFKKVLTTPEEITQCCNELNGDPNCLGVLMWMHTFSPAKMWINGLKRLQQPVCHLHTQLNAEIPWSSIDMDYMNLHQSAHGDREFAHLLSRMGIARKIVVGHWSDDNVGRRIGSWSRSAAGWDEMQHLKVARIGDNMREVAVTEGDKVAAQIQFGFSVNGFDSDDVGQYINQLETKEIDRLIAEYIADYQMDPKLEKGGTLHTALVEAAKIELGLQKFLDQGGFKAFTTTFENLGLLKQLPGISAQRLMQKGYGFAAEGDWKTAALLRAMKVMSEGLQKGTSFMEDYTYHFGEKKSLVLGSHMLEICPSIAQGQARCEIHPLSIGGKEDPVRLVFNAKTGPGINASLVDMGSHFRMVVNEVESVKIEENLPQLPVARVLLDPRPDFKQAVASWLRAGGAHHTVFSLDLKQEHLNDFSTMAKIECINIDKNSVFDNRDDLSHQIKS